MKVGLTVLTTTSYSSTSARRQSKKPSAACLEAASGRETSQGGCGGGAGGGRPCSPARVWATEARRHVPTSQLTRTHMSPSPAPPCTDGDREPSGSGAQRQSWDPIPLKHLSARGPRAKRFPCMRIGFPTYKMGTISPLASDGEDGKRKCVRDTWPRYESPIPSR